VAAAGLRWLFVADLAQLRAAPAGRQLLDTLMPEERIEHYATSSGVDVRRARALLVASYPLAELTVIETRGGEVEAERHFADRLPAGPVSDSPHPRVHLLQGVVGGYPETLVSVDDLLVARSTGDPTPARVVALRAMGRLGRSPSALEGAALSRIPKDILDAPLRFYAPGPFQDEWARGGRGLLAAAEAVAVAVSPSGDEVVIRVVLSGQWNDQDVERAGRAWDELARSGFGALLGLADPPGAPEITHGDDVLSLRTRAPLSTFSAGVAAAVFGRLDVEVPDASKPRPKAGASGDR
jgi:hypothetical protein